MSTEVIRRPLMSGFCAHTSTHPVTGETSHERCHRQGGGQRANPKKEFQPCPCPCHYGETFECGGCGRPIREALTWPFDEDGDLRYTHIDSEGRAIGEDCASAAPPKREPAAAKSRDKDCIRCGDPFTAVGRERICPECVAEDEAEIDDLADMDEDDDFAAMLAALEDV